MIFDLYETELVNGTLVDPPFQVTGTATAQLYLNEQTMIDGRSLKRAAAAMNATCRS